MMKGIGKFVVAVGVCAWVAGAQAQVTIETVTVGNPGNAGELSGAGAGGMGPDRTCGAVDYVYRIGKFEVTAGQYTAFLNAVAGADPYGLYDQQMDLDLYPISMGCNIKRSGSSPHYTYTVGAEWADRPVNYVSWGDAARFCNWLHNGQPTGAPDLSTTEDGSYYLNGGWTEEALMGLVRKPDATWVIPSEDEWYKAAYHHNDGVTGNYYDYATSSDDVPGNSLVSPDPGNNANFDGPGYTIGSPYYRTVAGEFENSESPYGTFDQAGNVWEWTETAYYGSYRVLRSGCFSAYAYYLHAANRPNYQPPTHEYAHFGLRVAEVSEPRPHDGDVDSDGDVDLADVAAFQRCFGAAPSEACLVAFDLDHDEHIDLFDFRLLGLRLSGPGVPAGMVLIPGGSFQMGDIFGDGYSDELPVHSVYLNAFYIGRCEVTKGLWDTARSWAISNGYDLYVGSGKAADHPVQSVNWYDCVKWCNARSQQEGRTPCYYTDAGLTTVYKAGEVAPYVKWDANGYRLPTEAEWEKAARGGRPGHRFPWSDTDTIQHARANYYSSEGYFYDTSSTRGYHPTFATEGYPYTSSVEYFAANGYGVYDMAGNVWQWCNDWYSGTYYSGSPGSNPTGPGSGSYRVLRGGGWGNYAYICRVAYRGYDVPGSRYGDRGFRVALDSE